MNRCAALIIVLLGLTVSQPALAKAPRRSTADIARAIGIDHGHIPRSTRLIYAEAIADTAARHDFDPLTLVSLIRNESRFRPGAMGDHGAAVGLGQIHYRHLCDGEVDCERKRRSLLDPVANIHAMGQLIALKQRWCREQTGKALLPNWLHAYGYNQSRTIRCMRIRTKSGWKDLPVPTAIKKIVAYRKRLIRLLSQPQSRRQASS